MFPVYQQAFLCNDGAELARLIQATVEWQEFTANQHVNNIAI